MTKRYISGTAFGATPWKEVTAETVSDWVLELRRRGLSPKTIRNVHSVASSAWKEAVLAGTAPRNPCVGLGPSEKTYAEDVAIFMTPAQQAALVEACPVHYKPLVVFLLASGLRWSEATALLVSDFDAVKGTVRVRQAWKDTGGEPGDKPLGLAKTDRSRRTVLLDTETATVIKDLLGGRSGNKFLFEKPRGGVIKYRSFYDVVWRNQICPVLDPELFPRRRIIIKDCRSTHVATLATRGASLLEVSRRLGHESVATTGDKYSFLFPEAEEGLALRLKGAFPKI